MAGIGVKKIWGGWDVCVDLEASPKCTLPKVFPFLIIYKPEVHALNGGLLFAIYIIKVLIFRCIMFPSGGEWGRMGLNGGLFLA